MDGEMRQQELEPEDRAAMKAFSLSPGPSVSLCHIPAVKGTVRSEGQGGGGHPLQPPPASTSTVKIPNRLLYQFTCFSNDRERRFIFSPP
ncbi:hypothetical protein EXN66_Car005969 [Channa argus]|uniref:Uncharacterized protein n=1 Tax=Channa argus TaxID=215402 RepID=A0A6G1PJ88_CHAAH|nr:hypothetical protein EXN66_Car005969 [Channa argus]